MIAIDGLFWVVALLWATAAGNLLFWVRRLQSLPGLDPQIQEQRPSVTIIVAARDEALRVQETVRTQLNQKFVDVKVVVVDDRSSDGTSAILAEWVRTNPELNVKRVDVLPAGWLGKTNAMQLGSADTTTEWLLFTDADCWLRDDVVARAIATAEREKADHVCLLPTFAQRALDRSFLTQSCHLAFATLFGEQLARVSADMPRGFCGVGAFNLVRTKAYHKFGGHEQLRLEVVDDPMLGVLIRRGGGRSRGFLASRDIECDWSYSVWGFVTILEKNYFAMFGYRTFLVHILCTLLLLLLLCGITGPLTLTPAGIACGIAYWAMSLPSLIVARKMGWPMLPAIFAPLAFFVMLLALVNSMWRTLLQGGIRWRDTFYTLAELRSSELKWGPTEKFTTTIK